MNNVLELIEKRNKAWEGAKAFLESKRDGEGLISEEDAKTYDEMEKKLKHMVMKLKGFSEWNLWIMK